MTAWKYCRSLIKFIAFCSIRLLSRLVIWENTIVVFAGGAFGNSVHSKANYDFVRSKFPDRRVVLVTAVPCEEGFYLRGVRGFLFLHFSRFLVADNGLPYSLNLNSKVLIQTWHAPAIKGVGKQDKLFESKNWIEKYQTERQWGDTAIVLCSGPSVRATMCASFNISDFQCAEAVPPYYLTLFAKASVQKKASQHFVIIYLPTYRDWDSGSRSWDLLLHEPFIKFVAENNVQVWYKYHPMDRFCPPPVLADKFLPIGRDSDYMDKLLSCDVLITDYSSVIFEALLAEKHLLIFAEDEEYFSENRGIFDREFFDKLPKFSVEKLGEMYLRPTSVDPTLCALADRYFSRGAAAATEATFRSAFGS